MYQTIKTCFNHILIVCMFFSFFAVNIQAVEHDPFDTLVRISKNKGTIYELLKDISKQSGYLLIYDSRIIDNDIKVKIKKGNYSLRDAIYLITGDNELRLDLSGEYIMLRRGEKQTITIINDDTSDEKQDSIFTIGGKLSDTETKEAVTFASVGIINTFLGTITNREGDFRLVVPDSLRNRKVRFSHIGYESIEIDLALLKGEVVDLELKPVVVPLNEVVVSGVRPEPLLNDMLNNRQANYSSEPVSLTTFYREGIDHDNKNIDITESVIQVYKTGYKRNAASDHVKLIKKRRVENRFLMDTIFPKMRSGVNSCLVLDIIKELPEFIAPDKDTQYKYSYAGRTVIDNRQVNIISFRQKEYINDPLYTGHIYIDNEKKALVEVRFEINPKFADKATNMFIDRKSPAIRINLQQARYIVSYKLSDDGFFYINHVRGDLRFKLRKRRQLFNSAIHLWFEMVTCDIVTKDVQNIPLNERLSKTRIFSETKHDYDKNFWENFNIILPEEALKENIIKNLNEIVITAGD